MINKFFPFKWLVPVAVIALVSCNNQSKQAATADNTLSDAEVKDGWKLLFDGKSTTSWRAYNGKTIPAGWSIEEGALKTSGTAHDAIGGDIVYGAEPYENFELTVDWKISKGGNSGIFYHIVEDTQYHAPYETAPEYQVIDDIGFPEKLEEWQKAGVDYAMYTPTTEKVLKPVGEWNHSRIVFTPAKVEYYLNDKLTVTFVPWSDDWNKRRTTGKWATYPGYGKAKSGLIGLQDHGSPVWFKNIKIKKL
ncbi:MAG: DUF1080 domain-containing protein [Sphingobacteriales bacterium]|nr:DUF1080 domain-containing protein [Sphingobacteriales bacterium]